MRPLSRRALMVSLRASERASERERPRGGRERGAGRPAKGSSQLSAKGLEPAPCKKPWLGGNSGAGVASRLLATEACTSAGDVPGGTALLPGGESAGSGGALE